MFILAGHQKNIDPFLSKIDIYINTSIHEEIPLSVLEAMSYVLPGIAPKVGGFVEIFSNAKEGFLIEKRDPKIFTEKCLLLA